MSAVNPFNPIPLCLLGPLPMIGMALYAHIHSDGLDKWTLFLTLTLTVLGWGIAAYLYFWNKKLIAQRVYLELKPNRIETANGEVFHTAFSSTDRLIADTTKLKKCVGDVAARMSHSRGRLFFARESAYVRIWPDGHGVSSLELNVIQEAFLSEFIDPVFEVADENGNQSSRELGIKA